jgi:Fe-S-cluster containining protein
MHMGSPPLLAPIPAVLATLGRAGDEPLWREMVGESPDWERVRSLPPEAEAELVGYLVPLSDDSVTGRGAEGNPCLWFDPEARRCRFYEHRPEVCRDFEVGSEDCLGHRKARGIA